MMATGGLVPKVEPEEPSETSRSGHGEPMNLVDPDFEERILELCSKFPKGITDEMISKDQPSLDKERMVKALQRLLSQVSVGRKEVDIEGGMMRIDAEGRKRGNDVIWKEGKGGICRRKDAREGIVICREGKGGRRWMMWRKGGIV